MNVKLIKWRTKPNMEKAFSLIKLTKKIDDLTTWQEFQEKGDYIWVTQ